MKNLLKILILTSILVSCQQETKKEIIVSNFNLKTDYADFKHKMTEFDTLKIWIDHSVDLYFAKERIEITKNSDSLKIKSEFIDETYIENPKWELVFEKIISENDTIWNFGSFLEKNKHRMNSKKGKHGNFQIKHKKDTISLITKGFTGIWKFNDEYIESIEKLYPNYSKQLNLIPEIIEGNFEPEEAQME